MQASAVICLYYTCVRFCIATYETDIRLSQKLASNLSHSSLNYLHAYTNT